MTKKDLLKAWGQALMEIGVDDADVLHIFARFLDLLPNDEEKPEWEKKFDMLTNVSQEYTIGNEKWTWKRLELKDFIREQMKKLGAEINRNYSTTGNLLTDIIRDSLKKRGVK